MLDRAGDDVRAFAGLLLRQRHALDRQVIGLGATAGEDDLLAVRAERRRHDLTSIVQRVQRCPAQAVDARRIAELLRKIWQHRGQNVRVYRRGSRMVQINAR